MNKQNAVVVKLTRKQLGAEVTERDKEKETNDVLKREKGKKES